MSMATPRKYMTEKTVKFEFEKENKNSVRYKEVPEDGMPPIVGSIYVQKWFAGNSKNIEVTINKKDQVLNLLINEQRFSSLALTAEPKGPRS